MNNLFEQFYKMFGIRIEAIFPWIVCAIGFFMYLSLHSQMHVLSEELNNLQAAQNSVSTLTRSDLTPVQVALDQANTKLNKLMVQSGAVSDRIPAIENELSLANQKLTFLENPKAGIVPASPSAPAQPAAQPAAPGQPAAPH